VKFGANNATTYTVNSKPPITAHLSRGAAGTVDVTVTPRRDKRNKWCRPVHLRVDPGGLEFGSHLGPAAGGTSVTITGANFTGATA